ncbi:Ger(x)C family spore germination protein [Bacillus marasmi]|uniref:Ger(x)C family spore germination protein n=1 Tax=Bacillus marasmi TaxID=1926279 RepID=UPI0011C818D0|nr:Ger(x)C family spore germination protein [Bacillus marasmi]
MSNLFSGKMIHKLCYIPLLFFILLLSGCWSSIEVHNMAITNVLGIDINEAGEYEVTAAIVRPGALFSPAMTEKMSDDHQNNFIFQTATGKSISKALYQLSNSIPEKVYLGHMNILLISQKVAQKRMQPTLDYFQRETRFRPNIKLIVTKEKVSEIIRTAPEFNATLGLEILDFTKAGRNISANMISDLSQFMKSFTSNTTDPVTGVLSTAKNIGIAANGENHTLNKELKDKVSVASLGGTAVFKHGKLYGFLNESETRGLLWVRGNVKNDIIVLNCGTNPNENVSIIIRDTKSQRIPDPTNPADKLTLKINVKADINEVNCPNMKLDSENIDELNQQLEKFVTKEVKTILTKAQKQWQTDVFSFGEAIYRKNPREWDKIAPNWRKDGLKNLHIRLQVQTNISRFGLHKEPSKAYESR